MKIHCFISTYDLYTFLYACYTSTVLNNGKFRNFPGGPEVKNPPFNAEDTGLILDRGTKVPHATGQSESLYAATRENPLTAVKTHRSQNHHHDRMNRQTSLILTTTVQDILPI